MKLKSFSKKSHLPTFGVVAVLLVLWQVGSSMVGSYLLPKPLDVLGGLIDVIATGTIWRHVFSTLLRVFFGFIFAVLLSLFFVLLAYKWKNAKIIIKDLNSVLNSFSVFVWIVL